MVEYAPRISSEPERKMLESVLKVYPHAVGGALVEDVRLAGKHLVFVDVLLAEERVIIEYDGEYWHRKRTRADGRKTRQLIRGGYRVIRVRERRGRRELAFLPMENDSLLQLSFDVSEEDYDSLVKEIVSFLG